MIAAEFTDDIGKEIVTQLKRGVKENKYCSAHVLRDGKRWYFDSVGCYWFTSEVLISDAPPHPDHFGIFHGGWVPSGERFGPGYPVDYSRPEVLYWLEALLDKSGMFAPVLPFLWHTEPTQIIEDCGFVFKDVLNPACNAGLLWTFMQATRLMFENCRRMEKFMYVREHYPELALLLTLTLQPYSNLDGVWCPTAVAHGEPLGNQGWRRSGFILNKTLTPSDIHSPNGSSRCFGGPFLDGYALRPPSRPLPEWIELFKKAAQDGRMVTI